MCVDIRHRSLRGREHDKMYEYFEKNNLCKQYVGNIDFQKWTQGQNGNLRNRAVKDEKAFSELVESVETFVHSYDWRKDLEKHAVSGVFQLLQTEGVLDRVENFRKFRVCMSLLYFHLGMIVLDQIQLATAPPDSQRQ